MTTEPESKVCQSCGQVFYRPTARNDSSFRWMRRKFCSAECSRTTTGWGARPAAAPRAQSSGGGERG